MVKVSAYNVGELGLIPGLGRSPGEENGNPLLYSCLENPMDGWRSLVGYSPWGHKELDRTETLFFWAPKSLLMVTAAMKFKNFFLGIKARTTLDSILKSRDITLLTKVCLVKVMIFPVVMYRL